MKLYAPKYYRNFKCIADRCRHSCCVGWEIDIDRDTLDKYSSLNEGYGKEIKSSIDYNETPHFILGKNERCPHLAESGLCKIICEMGEGYLCEICREHPRFYNDTPLGKEVGIGMACEEACRFILSSDEYDELEEIGETVGEELYFDFEAPFHRARVYSVLSDEALSYEEKLDKISEEYGVFLSAKTDDEWRDLIAELEYLDPLHRESFMNFSSKSPSQKAFEKQFERAFAYFIFRHCSGAESEGEFISSLGFALFCERLLRSVVAFLGAKKTDEIEEIARMISEEIEYSEDNTERIKNEFFIV